MCFPQYGLGLVGSEEGFFYRFKVNLFSCDFFPFAMMVYVLSRCLAYEGDVHIRATTIVPIIIVIFSFNIVGYHYCPRDVLLVRPR